MGSVLAAGIEWCFGPLVPSFDDAPAWSEITETVLLGPLPSATDVPGLLAAGVTHVVSALDEKQRDEVAWLGAHFQHLFLPANDSVDTDMAPHFMPVFEFMRSMTPRDRVLVHCRMGVSRSATLVIATIMRQQRKSFWDAFGFVHAKRPSVLPNIGFASQLQRLEQDLQLGPRFADEHQHAKSSVSLARYLIERCRVPIDQDTLAAGLRSHGFDAHATLLSLFAGDIPRVVVGLQRH